MKSAGLFEGSDLSVHRDFDLFKGLLVAIPVGLIIWGLIVLVVLYLAQ
ncbi:MAG: hypothetical protein OES46_07655 [Gammaproteobacteria bacterium]|jgi:hypothetical protein|nr:hypothetical protein [Gammaproteobacteria bacterium]